MNAIMSTARHPPVKPQPGGRRPRFRFTLRTMFVVTLLVCVLAAVLGGLLRAAGNEGLAASPVFYLLLAVFAPMLMMIAASLWQPLKKRLKHRGRDTPDD